MLEQATWPPPLPLSGRHSEVRRLASAVAEGRCASLVGMSNVGKSFVLRALCREGSPDGVCIYVDCNRMVEFTDQGFYELVLRCLKAGLTGPLAESLEQCYAQVIAPSTPFLGHLRFSEGISLVCEQAGRPIALVLDEFGEVVRGIDDRVLLNLRALRDTYPERLTYVTATRRRLGSLRRSHGSGEFAELSRQNTYFLAPLEADAAAALLGEWATGEALAVAPADLPLLMEETGGHPALLAAAARALDRLRTEAQAIGRPLTLAQIRDQLDSDPACLAECRDIWLELEPVEREALLQPQLPPEPLAPPGWLSLAERHLVRHTEDEFAPFCRLLATFLRRQRIARQMDARGVRVDVEAGEAWVDGRRVPSLTDLEYRLLLLLYGHLDKIVDKYAVVEAVWGQSYIDEVDDARIDKLVSRLRQKLEGDPARPRYLRTVRGRGYKLVGP